MDSSHPIGSIVDHNTKSSIDLKSVTVLGAGESGVSAALLGRSKGLEVFVSEYGSIKDNYRKELEQHKIPFEEKGHNFEIINRSDIIVKSPGIPESAEVIRNFRLRQKTIISEIEFGSYFYDGKIIGITGSNGKTTTTSLTYHVLKNAGFHVGIGGNIGNAFCRLLMEGNNYDWMVLELSSFQLDDIIQLKTEISVLLNITPDHLDRYDYDFEKYGKAKWKLIEAVKEGGLAILNQDDQLSMDFLNADLLPITVNKISAELPTASLSKDNGDLFDIQLIGRHNAFNAAVAKSVAEYLGLNEAQIEFGLSSFRAIEHRLEKVAVHEDVTFINDSKATNVDAVKFALEALEGPIIWIAGGVDKGNDYSSLERLVNEKVSVLICLGVDNQKLKDFFSHSVNEILETTDINVAVRQAFTLSENSQVLLSPACASFDLFDNYEHRGELFKRAVNSLIANDK